MPAHKEDRVGDAALLRVPESKHGASKEKATPSSDFLGMGMCRAASSVQTLRIVPPHDNSGPRQPPSPAEGQSLVSSLSPLPFF